LLLLVNTFVTVSGLELEVAVLLAWVLKLPGISSHPRPVWGLINLRLGLPVVLPV